MSMNLKPLRSIEEHQVLNFFSTVEGDITKGTFVQIVSFDPDKTNGWTNQLPGVPSSANSAAYETLAKVKAAVVTSGAVGLLLNDVVSSNANVFTIGDQMRYYDRIQSGKTCPILKKGEVSIGGFSGTPYPGARGAVINGQLVVTGASVTPNVGKFLSTSGADGYAYFDLNCI